MKQCACDFRGGGCLLAAPDGSTRCESCAHGLHKGHPSLDYSTAPVVYRDHPSGVAFVPGRAYEFFNGARQLRLSTYRGTTIDPIAFEALLVFDEEGVQVRYAPSAIHRPIERDDDFASGAGEDVEAYRG